MNHLSIFSRKKNFLFVFLFIVVFGFVIYANNNHEQEYLPEDNEILDSEEPDIFLNLEIDNDLGSFEGCEKFDKSIQRFMRYWRIKGCSFALMKNDSLIYAKGYGYADEENKIKCDTKHLFRIASVSKLITATAIMKLKEEGKISLDDKVFGVDGILNDSLFLNFRDKRVKNITIEQLLRHRACFSSPFGDPAFRGQYVARFLDKTLPITIDDLVEYASRNYLRCSPGSSSIYSNLGYVVLTRAIEKVTNQDYETYVKENILEPAGCFDMHIGKSFPSQFRENEVKYYDLNEAEDKPACDGSPQYLTRCAGGNNIQVLSGAGGWITSPVELLRFVASIDGDSVVPDILNKESIKEMTEYRSGYFPIGWSKVNSRDWFRSGSMAGTNALLKRQRDGYTFFFVSNTTIWTGSKFYRNISSEVAKDMRKVKEWPERDLWAKPQIPYLPSPITVLPTKNRFSLLSPFKEY